MNLTKCINWVLACAVAAILAACASAPADNSAAAPSADGTRMAAVTRTKCSSSDAPTGTSIVRKDCKTTSDVSSVDGRDFMDSKRTAMPDPLSTGR